MWRHPLLVRVSSLVQIVDGKDDCKEAFKLVSTVHFYLECWLGGTLTEQKSEIEKMVTDDILAAGRSIQGRKEIRSRFFKAIPYIQDEIRRVEGLN